MYIKDRNIRLSKRSSALSRLVCVLMAACRVGQYQTEGSQSSDSHSSVAAGLMSFTPRIEANKATNAKVATSIPRRISKRRLH